MKIDWDIVKRQTLWSYEDLIKKLQVVLAYAFVQNHYNHTMAQAQAYAKRIRSGYLRDQGEMTAYVDDMIASLAKLDSVGAGTYSELINQVATRERCTAFVERTHFEFDRLIRILNCLLRWVLPFETPLREYIDTAIAKDVMYLRALRGQKLRSNLDLLEVSRTRAGRARLSKVIGIPAAFITALVHRADISRLAYVRGKTVRHLCGGGYDTLEKISSADLAEMEERMDAYYRTLGKSSADFRSVIPLSWMIGGAKILPRVVKG